MNFIDSVHDLFEKYYDKKAEGEVSERLLLLRAEIEELVLTGEQIMESGITDFSEAHKEYEDEIEELKERLRTWKDAYKKLKNLYQENSGQYLRDGEAFRKLEKIIGGKQGPFIDEIRDAIK